MKLALLVVFTAFIVVVNCCSQCGDERASSENSFRIKNELARIAVKTKKGTAPKKGDQRQQKITKFLVKKPEAKKKVTESPKKKIQRQQTLAKFVKKELEEKEKKEENPVSPTLKEEFNRLFKGWKPQYFTYKEGENNNKYPMEERALLTMLWNGMNEQGGRAHVIIGEPFEVYESKQVLGGSTIHAEKQTPEFIKGEKTTAYMDKTPCTACTDFLISSYKGKTAPTLYASYLFTNDWINEGKSVDNLKKLKAAGFDVRLLTPEILTKLFPKYKDEINKVASTDDFKKGQIKFQKYLKDGGFKLI